MYPAPLVNWLLSVGIRGRTSVLIRSSIAPILFATVVLKLASSPNAAASSLSVFRAAGEESTRLDMAVFT